MTEERVVVTPSGLRIRCRTDEEHARVTAWVAWLAARQRADAERRKREEADVRLLRSPAYERGEDP